MVIENRGPELLAVNCGFVVTASLACALRCFVRVRMVKAFGGDDWLMLLAAFFFLSYAISSNIGIHFGTGRHYYDLSVENYGKARECWYFCYLFYSLSMMCSKLSIGFLLLRISNSKIHTWILYTAMFVSVVASATFFFVCVFQCYPVSYMWDKTSQSGTCVDITVISALAYTYSAFGIVSDFTFAIIPGFLVYHLQLKRRAKVALVPLMTMGCIASAAIFARMPFLKDFNSPDFLYATTDIAIWSTVEQGLAITAGSLATLRPLFFLAMQGLGLNTRPTGQRPSGYGSAKLTNSSFGATANSQREKHELRPVGTKLSSTAQTRISDDDYDEEVRRPEESARTSKWYPTNFVRPISMDMRKSEKRDSDNESQKSLRKEKIEADNESERSDRMKTSRSSDEAMQIMVSKTFSLSDEERGIQSSHGGPLQ